ncbi:MAG: GFA family protein [Pseudomonadota bacterium]
MPKLSGGCQCGRVRYELDGDLHTAAVCHCPSCRKATGAPLVGWVMIDVANVSCDRSTTKVFESSEGVRRSFCPTCGTTLFFEADMMPGLIDITTESLDDPDAARPTTQIWTKHETECVKALGTMARFEEFPSQG